MSDDATKFFWELVTPFLLKDTISQSTMMGFPCLRVNGDYFASADHRTGDLIIKLPASRVNELIEAEIGQPFAPAGRRFREWVAIQNRDAERWTQLITEAMNFVQDS